MRFSPRIVRCLKWALLSSVALLTLGAAAVTFHRGRGARAWRQCVEAAAARGDPVDAAIPLPVPVAPERNFFAVSTFGDARDFETNKATWAAWRRREIPWVISPVRWREGRATDYAKLATSFRADRRSAGLPALPPGPTSAAEVAGVLERARPTLDELHQAALTRSGSLYQPAEPAIPGSSPPPVSGATLYLGVALAVRAELALDAADSSNAYGDILAVLKLAQGIEQSRTVVMLRRGLANALLPIALQPVWVGGTRRLWSEQQLAGFEQQLSGMSPLEWALRAAPYERNESVNWSYPADSGPWREQFRRWVMAGRFDRIRCATFQHWEEYRACLQSVDTPRFLAKHQADREFAQPRRTQLRQEGLNWDSWRAWWLQEREWDPGHLRRWVLSAETWVRLARTALALERFRLAHDGALPAKLDELVPAFLPEVLRDPIDGAPLRYRVKKDGEFALYSIGLNGVDEDGALSNWTWTNGYMLGDWSWPMPVEE